MAEARRKFDQEFRQGAVRIVRETGKPARARVAAWIEEYNHDRRHSALGMRSPIDYELTTTQATTNQTTQHETTHTRTPSLTSSSPASRPSPPGGLRPALTPAPEELHKPPSGSRPTNRNNDIRSLLFQGIAGGFYYLDGSIDTWLGADKVAYRFGGSGHR